MESYNTRKMRESTRLSLGDKVSACCAILLISGAAIYNHYHPEKPKEQPQQYQVNTNKYHHSH